MKKLGFGVLLSGLLASMASLQDAPKGPFTLAVDVPDGKNPVQVCSRPDTLKITMLDRFGAPAPISGVTVVISTSDSDAPLNNVSGSTVNGVAIFPDSVQWFTVGKHTIRACTKDGSAKGEKGGFDVKALPQGLSLKMTKPLPEPKFIQASSACTYEGKLDAKGAAVEDVEIRVKLSRGAMMFPQRVFTDRNGNFSFVLFTPIFDCSVLGGGGGDRPVPGPIPIANALKGSPTLTMDIFLDPTNSGTFTPNSDQIGDVCPPIPVTTPCPSDLLLSALAELTILVNGHEVMPPPPGPIVAAAMTAPNVGKRREEENDQQERLEDAERFLRKEIIGFINSGKWDGRFSHVAHRIDHLVKFLRNIPTASSVSLKLHCAGETLKKDPDVKDVRLSIQEKDRKEAEVGVGFKANLDILLEGVDKKALPLSAFDSCTSPFLNSLTSTGPAKVTLTPNFQLSFGFECTGVGGVSLSPGVQFVPQIVTDITDATTVSADRVFSGASEVVRIDSIVFPITTEFKIDQVVRVQFLDNAKSPTNTILEFTPDNGSGRGPLADDPANAPKSRLETQLQFTWPLNKNQADTVQWDGDISNSFDKRSLTLTETGINTKEFKDQDGTTIVRIISQLDSEIPNSITASVTSSLFNVTDQKVTLGRFVPSGANPSQVFFTNRPHGPETDLPADIPDNEVFFISVRDRAAFRLGAKSVNVSLASAVGTTTIVLGRASNGTFISGPLVAIDRDVPFPTYSGLAPFTFVRAIAKMTLGDLEVAYQDAKNQAKVVPGAFLGKAISGFKDEFNTLKKLLEEELGYSVTMDLSCSRKNLIEGIPKKVLLYTFGHGAVKEKNNKEFFVGPTMDDDKELVPFEVPEDPNNKNKYVFVFFNGCKSGLDHPDVHTPKEFADRFGITKDSGAYLGWTRAVLEGTAATFAERLFIALKVKGQSVPLDAAIANVITKGHGILDTDLDTLGNPKTIIDMKGKK